MVPFILNTSKTQYGTSGEIELIQSTYLRVELY